MIGTGSFLGASTGCAEAAGQHSTNMTKDQCMTFGSLGSGLWAANGSRVRFPYPYHSWALLLSVSPRLDK